MSGLLNKRGLGVIRAIRNIDSCQERATRLTCRVADPDNAGQVVRARRSR